VGTDQLLEHQLNLFGQGVLNGRLIKWVLSVVSVDQVADPSYKLKELDEMQLKVRIEHRWEVGFISDIILGVDLGEGINFLHDRHLAHAVAIQSII